MAEPATDWVKIWTHLGPLFGVIIGAFGTWLQQRSSRRHADKTRFHDLRVKVYSSYLKKTNDIVLGFLEGRRNDNDLNELMLLGAQVSLIASEDTRAHLVEINETTMKMSEDLASTGSHQKAYNQHIRNFIEAARKEIEP